MSHKYHNQKIKPLAQIVAKICKENPQAMESSDYLWAILTNKIEGLKDKTTCINCGAGMKEYIYTFDIHDALLLKAMGDRVAKRVDQGMPFTEANVVYIQDLENLSYTGKSRTTKCSKLGLIAKHKNEDGKHKDWVVTRRGFRALRNEPVQRQVTVFRREIISRSEDTITIEEIFNKNKRTSKNSKSKNSYEKYYNDYDANKWYEFGDVHETKLI